MRDTRARSCLYRPWRGSAEPEEGWPPQGVKKHRVFLGSEGGALRMTSRSEGESGEMNIKPRLLCPANSGPSVVRPQAFGLTVPGPKGESGEGYFSFTTSPAKKDFELWGIPRLILTVRPLQERVQLNALLYDVPPYGCFPRLITYGTATLQGLEPLKEAAASLDLVATGHLLEAGHSLRLTLCVANLPFVLPVPGEGAAVIYGGGRAPWSCRCGR